MKTQSTICLLAGVAALNLAYLPTIHAQTTTSTPTNQTGAESDTKSPGTSAAQIRNGSTGTGATAASQPDKTSTKDTTNSLDKNPSTRDSDSANNSATKSPTTATTEDRISRTEKSSSSSSATASSGFSDKHFLVKAAEGGMTEVQLGQLAQQKGQSSSVKEFGAKMVTDHSTADAELKTLAQQKGVTVPDKLDAKHQAEVDKLNAMSGSDFDKAYVNDMVADHKATAEDFQKASTSAKDPDVQAFATKTLPTVQAHLAHVQSLQSQLK